MVKKEYQSAEEKYFGKEASLGKFLREFGIIGSGTVIGMFRLPTTLRKSLNKQTRLQREEFSKDVSRIIGVGSGYIAGAYADVLLAQYALQEASRKNYIPAIAWGATNLTSFLFEFGRYSKMEKELEKIDC